MEDFGYSNKKKKQEDGLGSMKKIALIAASLFSVACFIYVTIQAYNFFYSGNGKNVETIHSPEGQIKIMEEEKNALNNKESEINHAVYDDIFGNKKESLKQSKPKLRAITEPAIPPQIKELVKEKITTKTAEVKSEKTPEVKEKLLIHSGDKKEVQIPNLTSRVVRDLAFKYVFHQEGQAIKTNMGYFLDIASPFPISNAQDQVSDLFLGSPMTVKRVWIIKNRT